MFFRRFGIDGYFGNFLPRIVAYGDVPLRLDLWLVERPADSERICSIDCIGVVRTVITRWVNKPVAILDIEKIAGHRQPPVYQAHPGNIVPDR